MPNGDVSGGGFPVVDILEGPEVPGTGIPTGPAGTFIESVVSFFGGLFGSGSGGIAPPPAPLPPASIFDFASPFGPQSIQQQLRQFEVKARAGLAPSPITGRAPIPTPAEGGPPLVTERFAALPTILDVPELDEQERSPDMPVDVPLLTSSFLPALRQATTPAVTGFLGGLAQDVVQGLFARPLGELGLGQVPMTTQTAPMARVGACPPEKPSTRILRFIKANTGVAINLSRAKSLIRQLGLENAARCLGITAQEVCQLLIVASPRRRRGISASDIRIVKRTARRFETLKHDLGHLGTRAHHPRRGHHRRHAHK